MACMGRLRGRRHRAGVALAAALAALVIGPGAALAQSITVHWTAPGDDGIVGQAASYDLRYSTSPVAGSDTLSWWTAATATGPLPTPLPAGSTESYSVSGLEQGRTYYFLIRTADEVGNLSGFSNLAVKQAGPGTVDLPVPASFQALPAAGGVTLRWDPVPSGSGAGYRVRRRAGAGAPDTLLAALNLTTRTWADSTVVPGTRYEYRLSVFDATGEGTAAVADVTVPTDLLATTTRGLLGYPNPARQKVTFRFHGGTREGAPGRFHLAVYDLAGRRICELLRGPVSAGEQIVSWDCRSSGGTRLAPGLYNAILDGPEGKSVMRFAIVP